MKKEFAKSRAMRACVPTWSTCQRACVPAWLTYQRACVPAWFTCQRALVPIFTCERAIRQANISIWHANVPNGVPFLQFGVPTWAKSVPVFQTFILRNAKGNFYTLLLYKKFYIVYTYTYHVCVYLTDKLYYTILFETFLLFR